MSLLDHAVWWQVYPLGALGARVHDAQAHDGEAGVEHRLRRLDAWLDYAADLGCDGLLLGPVFASSTHGYDTLDHFRVDPRLGDDADFDHLLSRARDRGLAVMLDGVFNHVGAHHPMVERALRGGGGGVRVAGGRPVAWEGHDDLAVLDHADPAVADLVVSVMNHWLDRGIAGWRLDAAYCVPTGFWRTVLARVRADHPDALFLGEMIHGDYARIAEEATLDSVTQYELWKAIWSSLHDENFWELAWCLGRHDAVSARLVAQTFIGNHDVARIASLVGDSEAALAAVILFTLPGMPSIYYGDEQAFRGVKGQGETADDELRPELPADPSGLLPYGWWLHRLYQNLIGMRRRNPWLTRGRVDVTGKDRVWITYRVGGDGHAMEVEVRLEPGPRAVVRVDGGVVLNWPG